ncbi:MAG: TrkH family potassium uptake protein [Clostridia bacterium]|nr:TrkH family potassium uptake protein [Clostridia bacterium]
MQKITFRNKNNKLLNIAPTRIIVFSFAILILTGSFLLTLPIAAKNGQSTPFLDCLFTATSASCVTGLIVYDTYNHWSLFGQIVILSMIQMGGLGIITLATFFSVLLGRKVGLKGMLLAQESINNFSFEGVLKLVKRVVLITFAIELAGALILSISYVPRFGPVGFYLGIFHGISAFCNAGFDLMGIAGNGEYMSLVGFNNDPIIIYTIASLIIIGGLGFVVWKDLYEYRKTKSLMLHTKLVLVISACLIVFGAIFFFAFEHNNPATMGNLSTFEKVNSAIFHSVTTRTAGFNSLPTNDMREISKVATIILMFIGAAPGSTGGGIKVTTFGVIIFAIISQIMGSNDTIIFKRRVPHYVINKALSIAGLSGMLVVIVTTVILAAENKPFINVLYEATSAFGTVGISTGLTPGLSAISKVFLIVTMFLGRVGPLTFAIALSLRANKKASETVYPEGKIIVG